MANETASTPLTTEQIAQVRAEIEDLQAKALQHAATSKTLAAHYTRQFNAAKRFLKTASRLETSAKTRDFNAKMKAAREGTTPTPAAASAPTSNSKKS